MQPLSKSRNQLYPSEYVGRGTACGRYAKWIRRFLTALIDRNVVARIVSEVTLAGPGNFLLGIQKHLFPLRDPPGSPRNREQHGEHGHWEAHRLINEAGIEIHVGVEFPLHEIIIFQGDALALQSDFEERVLAHEFKHFIRDVLDDPRARIVILVHTMAESHQLDFAGLHTLDELGNLLDRADLQEHVKDFFIGAAVERTVESGDRRGRGGIRIDVGAADAANSVGRAVLLVVRSEERRVGKGGRYRWSPDQ